MQSLCARALCLCLALAALVSVASGRELYVRPNATSVCPGEPCLTLDQYRESSDTYITSNTVFKLLPGQHNLNYVFIVRDVVNISIEGRVDTSVKQPVVLSYTHYDGAFIFINGTNVSVRGVKIIIQIEFYGGRGSLFFLRGSNLLVADVDIARPFLYRENVGIEIRNAMHINITSVKTCGVSSGIHVDDSLYISLSAINVSEYREAGFAIRYSNFVVVKNVTVSNGRWYGIYTERSNHVSVLDTSINGSTEGITMYSGHYMTIRNVIISNT